MSAVWESVKQEFEPEGAFRDLYISHTTFSDWENALAFLRASDYHLSFIRDNESAELPLTAKAIFGIGENEHCVLSTDVDGNCLNCHFFSEDEIEFDFDPANVRDLASFEQLVNFVKRLGQAVNKPVGISIENYREATFLKFFPQTSKIQYCLTNSKRKIEI